MNNATSSAYREIRCPSLPLVNGCNKPSPYALVNRLFKTSMTKINSIGDRGSPCRRSRWCPITSPGSPLTKILVDAVVSRQETKLHQAVPKPKCCKISNRNEVSDCAACPFVVGSYATQRLFLSQSVFMVHLPPTLQCFLITSLRTGFSGFCGQTRFVADAFVGITYKRTRLKKTSTATTSSS